MDIGVLIIGSELTTGKRCDAHLGQAIKVLARRGLELSWCSIVADRPARIVRALRRSMSDGDLVFSFGGLGFTPDDHTRHCAAEAVGVPIARHPEAVAAIEAQFGQEADPVRVRMAELPYGCELIPNPVNGGPGFSLGDHHFLPGFRSMAWPMMEWVLDTLYPEIRNQAPAAEAIITVHDVVESQLLDVMNDFVRRYPDVRFSCLPHIGEDNARRLEFSVKGAQPRVAEAMAWLKKEVQHSGYRHTDHPR